LQAFERDTRLLAEPGRPSERNGATVWLCVDDFAARGANPVDYSQAAKAHYGKGDGFQQIGK